MSDQPAAQTSTSQHTTLTTERHPCSTGGIRTHSLSRRAAVGLRLRPRGHWDRHIMNFFLARKPPVGQDLLIHEDSRSHTIPHHSRQNSSGRVISPSQRPLPDNTQHSQQTDIHIPPMGFEPTSSAGERQQTYALDRAATGTSTLYEQLNVINEALITSFIVLSARFVPTYGCN